MRPRYVISYRRIRQPLISPIHGRCLPIRQHLSRLPRRTQTLVLLTPEATRPYSILAPIDPGVGAPTLEQPPTAQQIANPILQLAPNLRGFQATSKTGVCPRPTIELYGAHVLDAHCKLIEDNKPVLQMAMTFAWTALALFIVLSA